MAYTAKQGADLIIASLGKLGYPTDMYDTSTNDGVDNVFNTVGAFPPSMLNNVLEQVNIILVFNNYKVMFDSSDNPTRRFWRDFINYGGGVEDIFHKIIEAEDGFWAEDYFVDDVDTDDLAANIAKDLVSFKNEEIAKKFHTEMDKFRIKLSRSDLEIAKVFTPEGFTAYVDVQLANIQTSAEVKLQSIAIQQIKKVVTDNRIKFKRGYNVNNTNGVTDLVEDIKTVFDGMTSNVSTAFNYSELVQKSKKDDMYLITTPELKQRITTRGYANAFNLKDYEVEDRWLTLPYGTDLGTDEFGNKVLAILMDRKTIVLALRYWQMLPFRVNNTDYTNYFLKVMLVKGYNEFFNAVAFTGADISNFVDGATTGGEILITYNANNFNFEYFKANGIDVVFNEIQDMDYTYNLKYASVPRNSFIEFSASAANGYITLDGTTIAEAQGLYSSDNTFDMDFYANGNLSFA